MPRASLSPLKTQCDFLNDFSLFELRLCVFQVPEKFLQNVLIVSTRFLYF